MNTFYQYAINFNTTSDVLISGVSSTNLDEGANVQRPMLDGEPQPRTVWVGNYTQSIDFTTSQIKTVMDLLSSSGDCLVGKAITGSDTLDLYSQASLANGSRATTSVHNKYVVNEGIIVPTTLSAGNGPEAATLSVAVHPVSDGTNNPITYSINQALTGTPAPEQKYYAGPVELNGTDLAGVQSITINFGLNVVKFTESGKADNILVYIESKMPTITVTTHNIALAATYSRGVAISGSTKVYLRANAGVTRDANSSTDNLSFTAAEGLIISRSISGSPQTMAIDIIPNWDSTNAMIDYAAEAIS